jgi:hypothetical protein
MQFRGKIDVFYKIIRNTQTHYVVRVQNLNLLKQMVNKWPLNFKGLKNVKEIEIFHDLCDSYVAPSKVS